MGIPSYLPRSGESDLTDEELLILEVFVDDGRPVNYATDGSFGCMLNLPYEHGLPKDEVERIVRGMLDTAGLLRITIPDPVFWNSSVTVTREGGALWESERQPDWGRFLGVEELKDRGGVSLMFRSLDPSLIDEALATYRDYGGFLGLRSVGGPTPVENVEGLHWKSLGPGVSLRARYERHELSPRGNHDFWRRKTWWGDFHELFCLWEKDTRP